MLKLQIHSQTSAQTITNGADSFWIPQVRNCSIQLLCHIKLHLWCQNNRSYALFSYREKLKKLI